MDLGTAQKIYAPLTRQLGVWHGYFGVVGSAIQPRKRALGRIPHRFSYDPEFGLIPTKLGFVSPEHQAMDEQTKSLSQPLLMGVWTGWFQRESVTLLNISVFFQGTRTPTRDNVRREGSPTVRVSPP